VDLRVKRGTIHGLIGSNGSGKSTMMNVLTGIYVPTAGTIDFAGLKSCGVTMLLVEQFAAAALKVAYLGGGH